MSWIEEQDGFGVYDEENVFQEINGIEHYEFWQTSNGNIIRITDMSDNHLINCINKIKRMRNWRSDYFPILKLEAYKRGILI